MTKKFNIKDLEQDPDRTSQGMADYTKISLDDLVEDEQSIPTPDKNEPTLNEENSPPSPGTEVPKIKLNIPSKSKQDVKEAVVTRVELSKDQVSFKRNQMYSFLLKLLGFSTILIALDLTAHVLKVLEKIDISKIENFDSIFYGLDMKWNMIKFFVFLTGTYMITPDDKLVLNRYGIECRSVEVLNMFFVSSKVMLTWDEIAAVEYKVKLFEPHLFFYGINKEKIGQIDFNLESPDEFFKTIEKYAGKHHPLFKIRAKLTSI